MKKEECLKKECCNPCKVRMVMKKHHHHGGQKSGAIYGLAVVGALFYFLQGATTLGAILLGIGKAIFWPALLIFKLLTYLQM